MKSKTKVNQQGRRKRNPELVDTIINAKKNKNWFRISEVLSSPRKNKVEINLGVISKEAGESKVVAIPGKVLSMGNIDKKIKVVALGFSKNAQDKILKSGGSVSTILNEIKTNPEAKGVKILE